MYIFALLYLALAGLFAMLFGLGWHGGGSILIMALNVFMAVWMGLGFLVEIERVRGLKKSRKQYEETYK